MAAITLDIFGSDWQFFDEYYRKDLGGMIISSIIVKGGNNLSVIKVFYLYKRLLYCKIFSVYLKAICDVVWM